jgi:hypothetical protein
MANDATILETNFPDEIKIGIPDLEIGNPEGEPEKGVDRPKPDEWKPTQSGS